ncbi:uncharacterized protein involved in exopolysaccharide biosynthesis [Thioflavicoccus mobilis 8321]|uniref:Uncharacterized protein involved in exopolysaccharide biosynthesis n=1 Tax=Thioflavicoccus mobilis 8321 TaxID=765912 RepID=L0H0L5_9GAMM|nr:Wzz/FepE/Etk N-terminal domain-containing protein [Thioflavicoccus mobilis]AGA91766.1 uncharacterized protein involved in exopolysaccharide biosynthesis [Thioflavicoccus mobilis 8321]
MEEQTPDLREYLAILRRRKWQLILPTMVLLPIAVVIALELPPVYRSAATILIERQEIPPELIRTTVTSFADQRIQIIKQRVMTLKNLGDLIDKYGLYPEIRRRRSLNAAVAEMREDVKLEMVSASVIDPQSGRAKNATIAFTLSFESRTAAMTEKITNELVSLFMAENLRQREAAVEETTGFLREEANKLADQIRQLEASLATFKEEHHDNLPELFKLNREQMQRAEGQLRDNELTIRSLQEQQLLLQTQLAQIDPQLTLASAGGQATALTPQARLRQLEAEYVSVAARYGPTHPDRIAIERQMKALRKVVGSTDLGALRAQQAEIARKLETARERYSPEHPDVQRLERDLALADRRLAAAQSGESDAPTVQSEENPAYVQLKARLEGIEIEIKGLREAQGDLKARLKTYEQRMAEAPEIELQYKELTRGYDNAVAKYREVKDKQLEAELAEALESERKAERFTLIEPPVVPDEPIEPDRPKLLMLAVVGAVGAGVGHLVLREFLDKGLYGARTVQAITGAPPMAIIPHIGIAEERRRQVRRRLLLAGVAIVGLLIGIIGVHLFVKPLDLIWFSLLRKLDLYLPTVGALQGLGGAPCIA